MKIVFMGTPDFSVPVLEALLAAGHEIGYVVTQPDKARDRGKKIQYPPVKEAALAHGLRVLQPERIKNNTALFDTLRAWAPEVIIVVAYGQILPKEILDLPARGCLNVHASLLPRLRGASPIQQAIVSGETVTGVTIMQMDEGLDTGDMLSRTEVEIGDKNASRLHDALAEAGAKLLTETLNGLAAGKIRPIPQDDSKATYAGLIRKQDGKVDFSKSPVQIERLIRGFDPWPGAFCQLGEKTIRLWAARPLAGKSDAPAGTVLAANEEGLQVSCGGGILLITELQAPGKKRMRAGDYLRGNSICPGTLLN